MRKHLGNLPHWSIDLRKKQLKKLFFSLYVKRRFYSERWRKECGLLPKCPCLIKICKKKCCLIGLVQRSAITCMCCTEPWKHMNLFWRILSRTMSWLKKLCCYEKTLNLRLRWCLVESLPRMYAHKRVTFSRRNKMVRVDMKLPVKSW